jgi:hypothetical protein
MRISLHGFAGYCQLFPIEEYMKNVPPPLPLKREQDNSIIVFAGLAAFSVLLTEFMILNQFNNQVWILTVMFISSSAIIMILFLYFSLWYSNKVKVIRWIRRHGYRRFIVDRDVLEQVQQRRGSITFYDKSGHKYTIATSYEDSYRLVSIKPVKREDSEITESQL